MKFTKSILAKSTPAIEAEVMDQAKIDLIATGTDGVETAEQKPDVTTDVKASEIEQVIAGEVEPDNILAPSDEKAPADSKDAGANLPGALGAGDEVADAAGDSEIKPSEDEVVAGSAPAETTKQDPEADENEAVATGEETAAPSKEDAAAAVAADLDDGEEKPDEGVTAEDIAPGVVEEYTEEQKATFAGAAEEETGEAVDAIETATAAAENNDPETPELVEGAAEEVAEAEHASADLEMVADAITEETEEVAAVTEPETTDAEIAAVVEELPTEPVVEVPVEVSPTEDGETTEADEVTVEVPVETEQPLAEVPAEIVLDEPAAAAVIEEVPSEEPTGVAEVVVNTGDSVDGDAGTVVAEIVDAAPEPAFVAVAEGEVPADFTAEIDRDTSHLESELIVGEDIYTDLTAKLDTYPAVQAVLNEALDNGGISVEAAAFLSIFTARDGVPINMGVSLESFGYKARSLTKVSIESVAENIRDWFKKLMAWMKEQAARFAGWVKNFVGSIERLKNEAARVFKLVEDDTSGESKEVEDPVIADLSIGGKFSQENLARHLIELGDVVRRVLVPVNTALMKDTVKTAECISGLKGNEDEAAVASELMRTCQASDAEIRAKFTEPSSEDGFRQTKELLGGKVIRAMVIDNSHDYTLEEIASGGSILSVVSVSDAEAETKAKTLNSAEGKAVYEAISNILETLMNITDLYGDEGNSKKVADATAKAGEHLVSLAENKDTADFPALPDLRKIVGTLSKSVDTSFAAPLSYARSVCVSSIKYMGLRAASIKSEATEA